MKNTTEIQIQKFIFNLYPKIITEYKIYKFPITYWNYFRNMYRNIPNSQINSSFYLLYMEFLYVLINICERKRSIVLYIDNFPFVLSRKY